MRIAFVVNNYPPKLGGLENHVEALARKLTSRGHEIFVVTLAAEPEVEDTADIHIVRWREYFKVGGVLGFPPIGTLARLTRFIRTRDIDLVSVHTRFFPLTWLGVAAAKMTGRPVVLTEHGSDFVKSNSVLISSLSRMVDLTFGRWSWRVADLVLAVSENVQAFVARVGKTSSTLFYNAIDLIGEPAAAERAEPRYVFVGRLTEGKGWDAMLEMIAKLRSQNVAARGILVGDGPDRAAAVAYATQLGLQTAGNDAVVQFRGRIPRHEVVRALQGATLVNPTVLSEGFQTTLLEALDAGGRIITFPVAGAQLLMDQGAPVTIVTDKSSDGLVQAALSQLTTPSEPFPREKLSMWSWDARVSQFEDIATQLVTNAEHGWRQ